ncbi:WD repeat-containing protein 93 isoform X2 [Pleurodeles waltl]|uniref:WD repeat-containing protein 93 isoform X2 n=1 Tax=Pleurodeles waltl TaxID=8319 RepID=UPI0037098FCE
MPVYIRKGPLEIPDPSETNWSRDDEDDYYLMDPEQAHDRLPQPFRMIGRLVEEVLEEAWEIIKGNEVTREAEKIGSKQAMYQPSTEIQLSGKVICIAAGGTGKCIFVGLSVGVAVFSVPDYIWICGWETSSIEICTIRAAYLGNQTHVLATVDDMGIVRLLYFHKDALHLIKALNETDDISKRTICTNVQLSQGGDYAGVHLEGNGESWLEIHRLPKDSWLRELEHSKATTAPGSTAAATVPPRPGASTETLPGAQGTEAPEMVASAPNVDDIKLSSPLLIMKIKPPRPVSGSSFKSPQDAMQKSDDYSVIGSGHNHVISAHQWEQQEAIFCHEFRKYLEVENLDMQQGHKSSRGLFHFLLPCKVLQREGESKVPADVPNSVCVHWSGDQNLALYLLLRSPKEKTDAEPKPDLVWPCASPISCSAVSACSGYLALGFEDGAITVWEIKYSGSPVAILALPEESSIQNISFLENPEPVEQLPVDCFPSSLRVQILAWCTNGSLYFITAAAGKETNVISLKESSENGDERISAVVPVSILPSAAVLFFRSGAVELMNCAEREVVCRFVASSAYTLASPWQPVFTLDQENACLMFTGDERISKDETASCALFVFRFDSYPFMDSYQKKQELTPIAPPILPWGKRCQMFLQSRLQTLAERSTQQQDCWQKLQEHALEVQKISKERQKARFCTLVI